VKGAFGLDAESLDAAVLEVFRSKGYFQSNGMLVKGPVVQPCFDRSDILDVIISFQHFEPNDRLRKNEEVLESLGGIRMDPEAMIRVEDFEPLEMMARRGSVMRGHLIPERVGYCRREEASLFRAARAGEKTDEERLILRIIKDQQPIKRDRLLELSPLGPERTLDAVKSLYISSEVYLDHSRSYVAPRLVRMSSQTAWDRVVRRLFECFGIMTAETLSALLGRDLSMREVRASLRRLEREKFLVKGHLLRGSSLIHWASNAAFERLGNTHPSAKVVVPPSDILTTFLRVAYRDTLPDTGRHAVYSGSELIGSFNGKMRKGRFEVSDLDGDDECAEVISSYARKLGMILAEREVSKISEWEVMDFYQKSHPGA
jgi:hypothetical protein